MNFELRIAGPDDVVTYDDELVALRNANAINKQYLADRASHPEQEVLCVATVHPGEPLPELPAINWCRVHRAEALDSQYHCGDPYCADCKKVPNG